MSTSKIALVTGGSRGLGKDMALKLAQQGIDVMLTYHSQQAEAAAVVAAMQTVGAFLVIAMVVTPGATAYLLTGNYRVILDYNCSNFYALSVGLLADAIAG